MADAIPERRWRLDSQIVGRSSRSSRGINRLAHGRKINYHKQGRSQKVIFKLLLCKFLQSIPHLSLTVIAAPANCEPILEPGSIGPQIQVFFAYVRYTIPWAVILPSTAPKYQHHQPQHYASSLAMSLRIPTRRLADPGEIQLMICVPSKS
jgi:hypothetical protein